MYVESEQIGIDHQRHSCREQMKCMDTKEGRVGEGLMEGLGLTYAHH